MYLTRWSDFDRDFGRSVLALDQLRRRFDEMFRDFDQAGGAAGGYADNLWPRINLYDSGTELDMIAAVPGLSEKDLRIDATGDVVTISGERKLEPPEGYAVLRQERGDVHFSRSFALPCQVDVEKTTATVKNGMLSIRLAKVPEAQPRSIAVKKA